MAIYDLPIYIEVLILMIKVKLETQNWKKFVSGKIFFVILNIKVFFAKFKPETKRANNALGRQGTYIKLSLYFVSFILRFTKYF